MSLRDHLENHQVLIYFAAVLLGAGVAWGLPGTQVLEVAINPALALMLLVTFLQVPLATLGRAFVQGRFLGALLTANFVAIPLLVLGLTQFLPTDPLIRFGVTLVLLALCIDYVVTFAHIGKADAGLLLAATPVLLMAQMALLPLYLGLFLGDAAAQLVQPGPFIEAFVWLIALPLLVAVLLQRRAPQWLLDGLGLLPVPATALVLFLVVASVLPQLGAAHGVAGQVAPFYLAYAVLAPLVGWGVARVFRLPAPAGRAVAFSSATRNALVILPLALAVPGGMPVLPAVFVTQTLVELVAELGLIRWVPRLGR